jgi:hypothetical protein
MIWALVVIATELANARQLSTCRKEINCFLKKTSYANNDFFNSYLRLWIYYLIALILHMYFFSIRLKILLLNDTNIIIYLLCIINNIHTIRIIYNSFKIILILPTIWYLKVLFMVNLTSIRVIYECYCSKLT